MIRIYFRADRSNILDTARASSHRRGPVCSPLIAPGLDHHFTVGLGKSCLKRLSLVVVALLVHAPSILANTYAPNTLTDPIINTLNNATGQINGGTVISLRSALKAADNLGGTHTVNLATGTYDLTQAIPNREITVGNTSQNITINGNGPTNTIINMVNDANKDRILFINPTGTTNSPVITVQGIRFQNAFLSSDPYGGAAICAGGGSAESLTVTNCAFDNNTLPAGAYGGAAVCMQVRGNLTIDNSTFTNNVSNDADGGAVLFIIFSSTLGNGYGTLAVTNSTFTGNSVIFPGAPTSNGGALAFTGQGGNTPFSATITNNTFINNTTDGLGGAISANNGPNVTIAQIHFNRFVNNTASASALSSGLHFVESSGSVNAENNWWGCNTNPVNGASTAPCNQAGGDVAGGGALDANPWLQLKTAAAPTPICNSTPTTLGNTSTVTASFLNNSDGTAIPVANLSRLIGLPLTWTPALGSLSAQQLSVQANGTATALFTSDGTAGTGTVNAQVDNVPASEISPARASITVNATSIAPTSATGTTTICKGSGTTLTVAGGLKGSGATTQWYTGSCGGTLVFTGDAFAVSPTVTTNYFVRYNGTCNTTACAMVTVTVNDPSVAPTSITGTTTICNPGTTTLTAAGGTLGTGANYQWGTGPVVGTSPIGGATSATLMVSPTSTTTYWVRIENTMAPCGANTSGVTQVVTVNQPPAITSAIGTTFTVGANGNFQMMASGTPAPTFSVTGTLPSVVTLSSAGLLSGTPALGTGGVYPVTVSATNVCAPVALQDFTLTVNEAPAFTSANNSTFTVGVNGSFTVAVNGYPRPPIVLGGDPLPANLTFVDNGNGTGTISGQPAPGTGGVYNLTFMADNGIGRPALAKRRIDGSVGGATQSFTLTVNEAPSITSANSSTFTEGNFGAFSVMADGFPAPTFNTSDPLPSAVALSSSGLLSGTPATGTAGSYPLQITAANGIGSNDVEGFTLNVTAPVCVAPPADLIAWYPAEANAIDVKNAHNGTPSGGAGFAAGKVGQAFTFNGGAAVVSVPDDNAWDFGAAEFTIQTWVKFNTATTEDVLVGHSNGSGVVQKWIFWRKNGSLAFHLRGSATADITSTVAFTQTVGQWYHVAVTRSGNTYKFYVNGAQNGADVFDGNSVPDANVALTLGNAEALSALNGMLDEAQIFSRALLGSEIASTYNASTRGFCFDSLATTSAVSRKTHGAVGDFDVPLPLTGEPGVESRVGATPGNHKIVVTFNNPVTDGSATPTAGTVVGTPTFAGREMTINLTGVPNAQQITVTLSNVEDAFGQTLPSTLVKMNVLVGDSTGNKTVNSSDVSQTKGLSGDPTDATKFRCDFNTDGSVSASDVSQVKSATGTSIP